MTTVFISWSGETSREIAEEIREWIPSVLQFAKPYFTPNDIEKGAKWATEISSKLSDANTGIICLTKDNYEKPWILFEAGALSKDLDKSKVCPVLFGMEDTDLSGPLSSLQATAFKKTDFKKLMVSINDTGGDNKLSPETLNRVFEMWWPQLDSKITSILSKERKSSGEIRPDRDILEEILSLSRSNARSGRDIDSKTNVPAGFVRDLLDELDVAIERNVEIADDKLQSKFGKILALTKYLAHHSDAPRDMLSRIDKMEQRNDSFIPF
ncbi:TIR domain-containing protein [Pacificibacter marinus]|uniref:TIR domain-containing protein n=1 Tax=Pacificibacter marinus TaxID=658057 RepID=A0A1Y5SJF6_9RHOB|nr:TIR domain-containing protein [Pacificibacter marinus]SEK59931.1 TIR domain-containing protein [Pacificibacter marinus]SLN42208.1 hypothetical protein PAM7971_01997 [Pacificibacter marinus]